MLHAIIFYIFAFVLILSALLVVTARNPVHSVLYLILCFFNAAGLFILIGAEFIAFTLVIVYVGAVAVLFLFVVMMLDVDFVSLREGFVTYLPLGAAIGLVLLAQLVMLATGWVVAPDALFAGRLNPVPMIEGTSNTEALGQIIYTDYVLIFQLSGLVLLVAMLGAIVLTLRERSGVRRQNSDQQIGRKRHMAVELRKPNIGEGVL